MTTAKLVCPECQHENEAERIYCHSCGTRLDRSAVRVHKEPVDDTRKRVRKMFDPHRDRIRILLFTMGKLVLGACGAAAIVQMVLPPDVPAPPKLDFLSSQIRFDLERMSTRHQPPHIQYSQDEVNAFLNSALRSKKSSLNKPLLDFKGVSVMFAENYFAITTERSFFGYPLYTTCSYAPVSGDGKINVVSRGGSIGRLPVHPKIAQFMGVLLGDVYAALSREIRMVTKLRGIECHDQNVVLIAQAQ